MLFRHDATTEDSPGRHEALREELLLLSSSPSSSASSASASRRLRRLLSPTRTWAGRKLLLSDDPFSPSFSLSFGSLGSHVAVDFVEAPDENSAAELAGLLAGHQSAHFAEVDGVVRAATAPDDARVAEQYYLNQGGLYSDSLAELTPEEEKAGKAVAPGAWNRTLGSEQVREREEWRELREKEKRGRERGRKLTSTPPLPPNNRSSSASWTLASTTTTPT